MWPQQTAYPHDEHNEVTEVPHADLGNTAGSVPDHCNKAIIAIKRVTQICLFFPMNIKLMSTLDCNLVSVQ